MKRKAAPAGLVQRPGEVDRLYTLRPTGQLDEIFDDLLGLAILKGWTEETQVRGLADGAIYIRPRMAETSHGGPFRFILDRPHCKEHLSAAGAEMSPIIGLPAQQWASCALSKPEAGRSEEVVAELRRAWEESGDDLRSRNDALRLATGHFERNGDAVAYAEYRERSGARRAARSRAATGRSCSRG